MDNYLYYSWEKSDITYNICKVLLFARPHILYNIKMRISS